jgi:hypothetical protein
VSSPEVQRLLERLVSDSSFRERFRADPTGTARELGFAPLADELEHDGEAALQLLEQRVSRSSLAGALLAAAAEAVAVFELGGHLLGADAAQAAVGPPTGGTGLDPGQFGAHGTGGPLTPATDALLHDQNVTLDATGIADLQAGRIDPRVISLLTELSAHHRLVISSMCSDHPEHTSGGSISNHYYGRAFDIASIDGRPVDAGNDLARQLALELAHLDPAVRPSEIGSPWALPGAAYFTDAEHQNHLHVGYDDPITPDWHAPAADAGAAAPAPTPLPPPAAPVPAPPVAIVDDTSDGDSGDDGLSSDYTGDGDSGDDGSSSDDGPDSDEQEDGDGSDGESGGDSDSDSDAPGEGSNGEDANDDSGDPSGSDTSSDSSADAAPPTPSPDPSAAATPSVDAVGVADAFPGAAASQQQVAAWMAAAAERRGLPPELPVMAALVESGLRNLAYGDADSVGLFQMRQSVWDSGAYAGYTHRPELQLQWFLDHAEAVRQQRAAAGLPVDEQHYGDWIADVERPAEQFRGRYQLRLDEAHALLAPVDASSAPPANQAQVLPAVQPS